ncbi:MAG: hypothetical protein H7Z10_09060, partial [Gemmatimonadaceae bacterium]|nr:hypothetical protein [Acetobacteraceae bacterium]
MVRLIAPILLLLSLPGLAQARLLRLDVQETTLAFDGQSFGRVGTYDRITARAVIGVDPTDPSNAGITDIAIAPRNALGLVEATSDVVILRPTVADRGNGVLLYDVVNRGGMVGLGLLADARGADAGNGFPMRQGYTMVWSGWQHDVAPGRLRMVAPVLSGITGPSREEYVWDNATTPITATLSYPNADPAQATLTVRAREGDVRQTPPGLAFRFLDPQRIEVTRPPGFDAGAIYEFIHTARDPVLAGMGFAVVRDLVTFLRRDAEGNPLARGGAPEASHAYAIGISQSGRFLRDLLHQGFNDDEDGLPVFDAIVPVIAGARRTFTNARFAQPGRNPRQHEDRLYPGADFPFTYATTTDALTGRTDGLLARCQVMQTCPKIMQIDSDSEAYQGRAALLVTDTRGYSLDLPDTVRAYMLAGMPHNTTPGQVSGPQAACVMASNPLHPGAAARALLTALDAWVRHDAAPPASRYPTLAHGTLVEPGGFPAIPGVPHPAPFNTATAVNRDREPPEAGRGYPG